MEFEKFQLNFIKIQNYYRARIVKQFYEFRKILKIFWGDAYFDEILEQFKRMFMKFETFSR